MAIGNQTDFQVYPREFFTGMNEVLQQYTSVFNEGSQGALRLVTQDIRGEFERQSFMRKIANGTISHRDTSSTSSVTPEKMEQGELTAPKINRRIGPNSNTLDSWKKIAEDPEIFSFFYGQQVAEDVAADWLNTSILAGVTALETQTSGSNQMVYDATGESDPQLRTEYLVRAMKLMGDRAQRVRAWVMHSDSFFNLVESQILDKVTNVADVVIYGGVPGTLNRPVIVTDSPSLVDTQGVDSSTDAYRVLGLTEDAFITTQSEQQDIFSEIELGRENLVMTIQGEFAFSTRVKGFDYTGGSNPDDDTLGSGSNWSFEMHDRRLGPGVEIKVSE